MIEPSRNGRMDLLTWVGVAIVFLLACSIISVTVVLFYPFHPLTYYPTTMEKTTVKAGDLISYTAHFSKTTDKVGSMTRYLVFMNGDATVVLTPYGLADARSTDSHKTVTVQIPHATPPRRCKIRWVVIYDYFGIRQVAVWGETPIFEVTK